MKERERLIDQVSVKIIPQVVLDVPRHADKDATLKEQKKAAHGARAHDFRSGDRQFRPRHLSPVGIDGAAHDQRYGDVKNYARHDAGNS